MSFEDNPDDLVQLWPLDEREIAILRTCRGLSPECVAACIEAVRADAAYRQLPFNQQWKAYDERKRVAMVDAIALLPKEGT